MKIERVPFSVPDWSQIESVEHAGKTGKAIWRTIEVGNVRVRKVEYSPGYAADHWCTSSPLQRIARRCVRGGLQDADRPGRAGAPPVRVPVGTAGLVSRFRGPSSTRSCLHTWAHRRGRAGTAG